MNSGSRDPDHLTDGQVIDLLHLGLDDRGDTALDSGDWWYWLHMRADLLAARSRELFDVHHLDERCIAGLLGVSELTIRRWFSTSKAWSRPVREKLAGLCFLVCYAQDQTTDPQAKKLIDAALAAVREDGDGTRDPIDDRSENDLCVRGVNRLYGVPGLMAAALQVLLQQQLVEPPGDRAES